jgi:hypothetical protein
MRRFIAAVQGLYYAATGAWPFIHLGSFLAVTGPKTDIWLVYTVSVLILVIGMVCLAAAWANRVSAEVIVLAVGSAMGLTGIDVVFVLRDVISEVYLLDAVAEVLLIAGWGIAVLLHSRAGQEKSLRREPVGTHTTTVRASS